MVGSSRMLKFWIVTLCGFRARGEVCSGVQAGWQNLTLPGGITKQYTCAGESVDWNRAKALCESLGGSLPCIERAEENDFIGSRFAGSQSVWLGINKCAASNGIWDWKPFCGSSFTNWDDSQGFPLSGEWCGGFHPSRFGHNRWHDYFCDGEQGSTFRAVCERSISIVPADKSYVCNNAGGLTILPDSPKDVGTHSASRMPRGLHVLNFSHYHVQAKQEEEERGDSVAGWMMLGIPLLMACIIGGAGTVIGVMMCKHYKCCCWLEEQPAATPVADFGGAAVIGQPVQEGSKVEN